MLDKRLPKYYCHITSLKDVKDLNIKISELNGETKIICPISMIEFSGLNTFYFFWNCGCLVSKKAYDELNMKDKCILCGEKFDKNTDLVNINYSKEERKERFESIMAEKKRNKILRDKKKSDKKINNELVNKNKNDNKNKNKELNNEFINKKRKRIPE